MRRRRRRISVSSLLSLCFSLTLPKCRSTAHTHLFPRRQSTAVRESLSPSCSRNEYRETWACCSALSTVPTLSREVSSSEGSKVCQQLPKIGEFSTVRTGRVSHLEPLPSFSASRRPVSDGRVCGREESTGPASSSSRERLRRPLMDRPFPV